MKVKYDNIKKYTIEHCQPYFAVNLGQTFCDVLLFVKNNLVVKLKYIEIGQPEDGSKRSYVYFSDIDDVVDEINTKFGEVYEL